jgi:hypothetical protein
VNAFLAGAGWHLICIGIFRRDGLDNIAMKQNKKTSQAFQRARVLTERKYGK